MSVINSNCMLQVIIRYANIYLIVGIDIKNGNRIFHTSKHTLKEDLLDKSRLKCSSNTVVTLQC